MGDVSIKDRAAHSDIPVGKPWEPAAGFLDLRLGHAVVSVERDHLTIEPVQSGERRLAQPSGAPYYSLEDRLQVSWRTSDDTQDFTRGRLLLQRFLELFKQPNIFDGDHGLVGESFKQFDLRRGEGAHLDATCVKRSDELRS